MRFSVIVLVIAGIAAALAASVAVSALSAQSWNLSGKGITHNAPDITVLVAKEPLAAMSVLDEKSIETKSIPRDKAPPNAVTDPLQAVGKVLVSSLAQGQAITTNAFAPEGSRLQLASKLPPGMRAVSVNVTDASGLHGDLYPGSTVDVTVTIKRTTSEEVPETIATTILENILVLGVEEETIVNTQGDKRDDPNSRARVAKVTLMVDMQQAKSLQLAQDVGVIWLAMRKPGDKTKNPESTPVTLREIAGLPAPVPGPRPEKSASAATEPASAADEARFEQWQTTIIRGNVTETRAYFMPAKPDSAQAHN